MFLLVPFVGLLGGHGPSRGHLRHIYFICSSWGSHFRVVTGRRPFSPPGCQPRYGLTVLRWSAGDHASEDGRAHLLVSLRCLSGNTIRVSLSLYSFSVMVGCGRDVFLIFLESSLFPFRSTDLGLSRPLPRSLCPRLARSVPTSCSPRRPGSRLELRPGSQSSTSVM